MKTCFRWIAIGVCGVLAAGAQTPDTRGAVLRGEIISSSRLTGPLTVELTPIGEGRTERALLNTDGSFELHYTQSGPGNLRLLGPGGAVVYEQLLLVNSATPIVSIRLPDRPLPDRTGPGTISFRQLMHKVPPQAQKFYDKGEQAATKGNTSEAMELFRRAVAIDPEFVEGFNELGAVEAKSGNLDAAVEEFQKALDLDPEHPLALCNLTIVLAKLGRFREAGVTARRALKIVPDSGRVHYILAATLLFQNGDREEALDNFERAADEIPKAHLAAADLLVERGRRQEAIRHLEQYLQAVPADDKDRDRVNARLAELRAQNP